MKRVLALSYGVACYAIFFGTFLALIAFLAGLELPWSVDSGAVTPAGTALAADVALLALFGLQHSAMARPGFKRRWKRILPAPIERSTYVLISSLLLLSTFVLWRPLPFVIWSVEHPIGVGALWALFGLGWALVLLATFALDHFALFGLRQVYDFARGREPRIPALREPLFYAYVRHPIYLGWLIAFWATPVMTAGHALFAGVLTAYILIAIPLEERDLVSIHGPAYQDYRERVAMLLPLRGRSPARPREARTDRVAP